MIPKLIFIENPQKTRRVQGTRSYLYGRAQPIQIGLGFMTKMMRNFEKRNAQQYRQSSLTIKKPSIRMRVCERRFYNRPRTYGGFWAPSVISS